MACGRGPEAGDGRCLEGSSGHPILDGVQGGSLGQVVSGMSMPTRSRDTVANWEPAAQPVPLPGKACFWVHKGLSVWGQR